jgi:predicted RecA/RadA family phage recombinase
LVGAPAHRASGLHKLRAAYTGPAVRVRRSSDNLEQDIGFNGNDLDTVALRNFTGTGSGYIKTWYDQSGNVRHLTQTVAGRQARVINAGVIDVLNAKPTAVFDGIDDYYTDSNTGLYAAGSATLSVVMKAPTPTAAATKVLVSESSNTATYEKPAYRLLRSSEARLNVQIASQDAYVFAKSAGSAFDDRGHAAYSTDTGSVITTHVDGILGVNSPYTRSGTLNLNNFSVGASVQAATNNYYLGSLSEFTTWTSALSSTQQAPGQANQKSYYALP